MVTPEILQYVKEQTHKGVPRAVIARSLLNAGWTVTDINTALDSVIAQAPVPSKPKSKYTWGYILTWTAVIVILLIAEFYISSYLASR